MKTKFMLMTGFMLMNLLAYSQIKYDFNRPSNLEKIEPVKLNNFITFKVENINTFRYRVLIQGKNIDYVTQVPSELQTIFRLPKQELDQDSDNTKTAVAEAKAAGDLMSVEAKKAADNLEKNPAGLAGTALDNLGDYKKLLDDLSSVCAEYVKSFEEVAKLKFHRIKLINLSKSRWKSHNELVNEMPRDFSESAMKKAYVDFVSLYVKVEVLYEKAKEEVKKKPYKADELAIKEAASAIDDGYHNIEEVAILSLIDDIITLQTELRKSEYFTVNSPPIQMDGDFVEFDVNITPAKVNNLLPYEPATGFKVQVPTVGGWRADFSVGPAISLGRGARHDKFFLDSSVDPDTDIDPTTFGETGILKKASPPDAIRPGTAAMIHAYRRTGKEASIGLMFGVGVGFESFDDVDLSLYVGPTVVVGKREKFMISSGFSFHRVDRLRGGLEVGTTYNLTDIDLDNITQKLIRPSCFISLSYALGTRVVIK